MKNLTEFIKESLLDMNADVDFESEIITKTGAEYKELMNIIRSGNFHRDRDAIDNGDLYYHYGLIYAPKMLEIAGLDDKEIEKSYISIYISQSWNTAPKQGVQITIIISVNNKYKYGKTIKLDPYKYAKKNDCVKYMTKEFFKNPITTIETLKDVINNKDKFSKEIL